MSQDEREAVVVFLSELDAWCAARGAKVTAKAGKHVMDGGSLNAPNYRTALGKHQAYAAVRSYISGARRALTAKGRAMQ